MLQYARKCPQCKTSFNAATERGICPNCNLFSRVGRDENLIVLLDAEYMGNLPRDDPHGEGPLAVLWENMEYGGGPIVTAERYGGSPPIDLVHQQLENRFNEIRDMLSVEIPGLDFERITTPSAHPDWIGCSFADAEELLVLTWFVHDSRYDVVCELTKDGGAIHAVPYDAEYHVR